MSAEGCSSSESGWTMYIASPMEEDEADCSSEDEKKRRLAYQAYRENVTEDHDMDTDDSMASDASSGPTPHHHTAQSHRKDDAKEATRLSRKKQLPSHHSTTAKKDQKRNREKSTRRK